MKVWQEGTYEGMTHPDGWKDEESDVDDPFKHLPKKAPIDYVRSPETSAKPCGCDIGANWVCVWHQKLKRD